MISTALSWLLNFRHFYFSINIIYSLLLYFIEKIVFNMINFKEYLMSFDFAMNYQIILIEETVSSAGCYHIIRIYLVMNNDCK